MNAREGRTVEAITAHFARTRRVPGPGELARVVGTASGASGCALTVAGVRHQWGDGTGPWLEHPVRYDGEDQGVLALSPDSAGPLTAIAAVLGAPVARDGNGGLEFAVADTGPGFTAPVRNSGLHNLSARLAAVGGAQYVDAGTGVVVPRRPQPSRHPEPARRFPQRFPLGRAPAPGGGEEHQTVAFHRFPCRRRRRSLSRPPGAAHRSRTARAGARRRRRRPEPE